jgi:DUF4097 and DUF4098 domain-containing protein YvlB
MKRAVLILSAAALAAAAPLPASAQASGEAATVVRERVRDARRAVVYQRRADERVEQTDRQTRTLRLGSNGILDLSNIAGDITITRGGGSDATIEIVKIARGRTAEDARELLQLVQVEVAERGARAEVRTRYPRSEEMRRGNRRNVNVSVNFVVTAPEGARITAKSISGDVSAKDIRGELALESVSGDIQIQNGGRVAAAKSISGDVNVTDTEVEGMLEASTASGTVTLRRLKARRLEAGSVSGDVVLDDVECGQVEAQSVSGDVRFAGVLERSGHYELTSHSGTVQVAVGGGAGFEVEASTFSGSVRSDLALKSRDTGPDRGRRQRSLNGVYGDGSAVLELSAFSGNIVITKR